MNDGLSQARAAIGAREIWLYFVKDETTAGIFVGLWVPSIHSLGALLLAPVEGPVTQSQVGERS